MDRAPKGIYFPHNERFNRMGDVVVMQNVAALTTNQAFELDALEGLIRREDRHQRNILLLKRASCLAGTGIFATLAVGFLKAAQIDAHADISLMGGIPDAVRGFLDKGAPVVAEGIGGIYVGFKGFITGKKQVEARADLARQLQAVTELRRRYERKEKVHAAYEAVVQEAGIPTKDFVAEACGRKVEPLLKEVKRIVGEALGGLNHLELQQVERRLGIVENSTEGVRRFDHTSLLYKLLSLVVIDERREGFTGEVSSIFHDMVYDLVEGMSIHKAMQV